MHDKQSIQTYLTRLMLLEKENRELRVALDESHDCEGNSAQKVPAVPEDKYNYLLSTQLESAMAIDMSARPPRITDCNSRAKELFSNINKSIIGAEITDYIPSNQKEHFHDSLKQVQLYKKHHFELIRIDEHREKQIIDVTGYALEKDAKELVILRLRDVTYRNELTAKNPEFAKNEESAFKNYPVYSFYFQFDGEDFILARAEDEKGELVFRDKLRKNASELLSGRRDLVVDMKQCLREGLRFSRESFFNGFFTDHTIFASFHYAWQQPDYVVMNVYDLSLQKAMQLELNVAREKAEQSERLKTAFLNNINVELRTPLNAINGFSQIIAAATGGDEQMIQYCNQIRQNTRHLVNIITDIMELARIESGDLKVNYSGIYLNETMDEYEKIARQLLHEQGKENISLIVNNDRPAGNDLYDTDPDRLKQIMVNLIDNAVRFTNEGEIRFGYTYSQGMISFFVEDTGVGIPYEDHKAVFNRFYKSDNQQIFGEPGVGLGLSIANQLAQLMGADGIALKSTPGRGSTFTFDLPL